MADDRGPMGIFEGYGEYEAEGVLIGAIARNNGDTRTNDEMARDGARLAISQIDKLRNQLTQAERACQHVIATGKPRKDDAAIWKRVVKAADKLLGDFA